MRLALIIYSRARTICARRCLTRGRRSCARDLSIGQYFLDMYRACGMAWTLWRSRHVFFGRQHFLRTPRAYGMVWALRGNRNLCWGCWVRQYGRGRGLGCSHAHSCRCRDPDRGCWRRMKQDCTVRHIVSSQPQQRRDTSGSRGRCSNP